MRRLIWIMLSCLLLVASVGVGCAHHRPYGGCARGACRAPSYAAPGGGILPGSGTVAPYGGADPYAPTYQSPPVQGGSGLR